MQVKFTFAHSLVSASHENNSKFMWTYLIKPAILEILSFEIYSKYPNGILHLILADWKENVNN